MWRRIFESLRNLVIAFSIFTAVEVKTVLDRIGKLGNLNLGSAELLFLSSFGGVVRKLRLDTLGTGYLGIGLDIRGSGGASNLVR